MKKIKYFGLVLVLFFLFGNGACFAQASDVSRDVLSHFDSQTVQDSSYLFDVGRINSNVYLHNFLIGSITRDSIEFEKYYMERDWTIYVLVNGTTYSYKYNNERAIINYPMQNEGTEISIWIEDEDGNASEPVIKTIKNCTLDTDYITEEAYPKEMTITELYNYADARTVSVIIGNNTYKGTFQNKRVTVSYPLQPVGTKIAYILYDQHGCPSKRLEAIVENEYISTYHIKVTSTTASCDIKENQRLCVKVGDQVYYSGYATGEATVTVSFPMQNDGTKLAIWVEAKNGSTSSIQEEMLDYSDFLGYEGIYVYINKSNVTTSSISGKAFDDIMEEDYEEDEDYEEYLEEEDDGDGVKINLKSVTAVIGDKTYSGTVNGSNFSVRYPLQKPGTVVKVIATDTNGYQATRQVTIKNRPIKVNLYYTNNEVYGDTAAKAKITIKVGKKTYKTTANGKGKFRIKAKVKLGTTIQATFVNPKNNYYNTMKFKAKDYRTTLRLKKAVYVNSTSLSVTIQNPDKKDTIKLTIGNKVYTKKITKYSKKGTFTFRIQKPQVGSKIKIVLLNQYKQKRKQLTSKVYLSNTIKKGMTMKQVLQTTWGSPTRRNSYNGLIQWVYDYGESTVYVYFKNGRVTSINKYNY